MRKRVLLLFNPRSTRGIGDRSLPMGLLMACTYLHESLDVVLVDQRVEPRWKEILRNALDREPVCMGVTVLTGRQISQGLIAALMAQHANCPVVLGGIHPSILPEQTLSHPLVDYVVQGEGEESFRDLVHALEEGDETSRIPGVWRKERERPLFGGPRDFVQLTSLPPTPFHLVDLKRYVQTGPHGPSITMFSSRGCPQRCAFCYNSCFNRSRWRPFHLDQVFGDLEALLAHRPELRHVQFWDDNFFVSLKRARQIAERMAGLGDSFTWSVLGAHIQDILRMKEGDLALFKGSGLQSVAVGVESGSQRILDMVGKSFTVEQIFEANRRLGQHGICPTYSFLSGIPGETWEDIRSTVDLMFRLKRDNPRIVVGNIKPFLCYPGTQLHDKALTLGWKSPQRLEDWSDYVWTNYLNLGIPWLSPKEKRLRTWLYYYTVLMNPRYMFIRSRLFTWTATLLRPFAEWRVKHLYLGFPLAAWLLYQIQRILF